MFKSLGMLEFEVDLLESSSSAEIWSGLKLTRESIQFVCKKPHFVSLCEE